MQGDASDSGQEDDTSDSIPGPRPSVAAFSIAQALSMVRQRREEQDRSRQDEERQLEEQRREKAKEKRQRRRKNQKEKKAKLKQATAMTQEQTSATSTTADDAGGDESPRLNIEHDCVMSEEDNHAKGTKRPHDQEIDNNQKIDDEINLKRLPVKKRLRLKTATDETFTTSEHPPSAPGTLQSNTKKVTSLVPRALLLKSATKR